MLASGRSWLAEGPFEGFGLSLKSILCCASARSNQIAAKLTGHVSSDHNHLLVQYQSRACSTKGSLDGSSTRKISFAEITRARLNEHLWRIFSLISWMNTYTNYARGLNSCSGCVLYTQLSHALWAPTLRVEIMQYASCDVFSYRLIMMWYSMDNFDCFLARQCQQETSATHLLGFIRD